MYSASAAPSPSEQFVNTETESIDPALTSLKISKQRRQSASPTQAPRSRAQLASTRVVLTGWTAEAEPAVALAHAYCTALVAGVSMDVPVKLYVTGPRFLS